jgi:hypothetical protein
MLLEGNADADAYSRAEDALRNMEFDRYSVAAAMHREYSKCFERKNQRSAKADAKGKAKAK